MTYINYNHNGNRETIDEFDNRQDAQKMLDEYRMSDPSGKYYTSRTPCKNWSV